MATGAEGTAAAFNLGVDNEAKGAYRYSTNELRRKG
jgi:hypothetical protein